MADVVVGRDKCGEQRLVSLPLSRIRVIMKSSPEVSSINQEALVLTAKATVRRVLRGRSEEQGSGRGAAGSRHAAHYLSARAPPAPLRGLARACPFASRLTSFPRRARPTPARPLSFGPAFRAPLPSSLALPSPRPLRAAPAFPRAW